MGDTEFGSWGSNDLGRHIIQEENRKTADNLRQASELVVSYLEKVSQLYALPPVELVDWVKTRTEERFGNG